MGNSFDPKAPSNQRTCATELSNHGTNAGMLQTLSWRASDSAPRTGWGLGIPRRDHIDINLAVLSRITAGVHAACPGARRIHVRSAD